MRQCRTSNSRRRSFRFFMGRIGWVSDTPAVHMPWLIHHTMTINCNVLMHVTFKETHEKILNQNKNNRIEVDHQQVQIVRLELFTSSSAPFGCCGGGQLVDRHFRPPPTYCTSIPPRIYSARVLVATFVERSGWILELFRVERQKKKKLDKNRKEKVSEWKKNIISMQLIRNPIDFCSFPWGDDVIPFGFSFF